MGRETLRQLPGALAADAVEAELDLTICITEGTPVRDMLALKDKMKKAEEEGNN